MAHTAGTNRETIGNAEWHFLREGAQPEPNTFQESLVQDGNMICIIQRLEISPSVGTHPKHLSKYDIHRTISYVTLGLIPPE